MIEAIIKVRAPENWFEFRTTRYTIPAAAYGLASLVATINSAIAASGAELGLVLSTPIPGVDNCTVNPPDADPWTIDAGRGILEMLGLENTTSGSMTGVGELCRGRLDATIRRQFGMEPKFSSQHSHRAVGTVAWGQHRAEDVLILDFSEADAGLWCRFVDQVAAGLLRVDGTDYFLLDDQAPLTRVNGLLRAELTVVEA